MIRKIGVVQELVKETDLEKIVSRETGKLVSQHCIEAMDASTALNCLSDSRRLHVRDRKSGLLFFIDTGSVISLVPVEAKSISQPALFAPYAANNMHINAYGQRVLVLGLRRPILWSFCIADITYPIIGADLTSCFGLLVDLRERRLLTL